MYGIFVGFDSAWGARNKGAISEIVVEEDGSLILAQGPVAETWTGAIQRARRQEDAPLNIWAIDQPICVANHSGCRPVDIDLASALMADFGCGAHASNLGNPCWAADAGIWELLRTLEKNGYQHEPMSIPRAEKGRYFFECYPHPAILGLFELDHILKYKLRHCNTQAWQELLTLLRNLPIANIDSFVTQRLPQTKDNENKVDAIICAYVAAYWWKHGVEKSTMIGDTQTGYIVTPHNDRTRRAFASTFRDRINVQGRACSPPDHGRQFAPTAKTVEVIPAPDPGLPQLPSEPSTGWNDPVTLRATDTTNVWRTSRGNVINPWMDANRMVGYHLWVRFTEEDGEPAVLFLPFDGGGEQQQGMKTANRQINRQLWQALVTNAGRNNPIDFPILYCYQPI